MSVNEEKPKHPSLHTRTLFSGTMCVLRYEHNQFGHSEIEIKGEFEQTHIFFIDYPAEEM